MASAAFSHVVGFDDAPFPRSHRGDVPVVGAVFAGTRLDGILHGKVRRDGANAARSLVRLIATSKFAPQIQLVLLQGVALAGFNVVDLHEINRRLGVPALIVARRPPRLAQIREALLTRVPGGARKWRLIARLGPMEPIAGLFVQRVGLSAAEAARVLERLSLHSRVPEPLRVAHLIAGAIVMGQSRGRV